MNPTNAVFITALSIIGLGFFLKYKGIITEKEGKIITKLLVHTTFPALVFVTIMRVKIEADLLLLPVFCISFSAISMTIAGLLFKSQTKRLRGLLTMASGGFNLGLFAFPLIEGIWDPQGWSLLRYLIWETLLWFSVWYMEQASFLQKPMRLKW
jgi:predicted permease